MPKPAARETLEREWQALLASLPPERTASARWFQAGEHARPGSPVALYAELEEVRRLWSDLSRSPQLEACADRFLTAAWTLKDMLAHVASWAREFRQEVETVLRGESFGYVIPFAMSVMGPNQWNQVEVDKRRQQSLKAILQEFDSETARLEELVLELPEDTLTADATFPLAPAGDPAALWRASIAQTVLAKCMHDRYHLGRIQQWLATVRQAR